MGLLAGAGVRLRFANGAPRELRQPGDLVEFDGAIATECELIAGPCTDLNLIVSRSIPRPAAHVEHLRAPRPVGGKRGCTVLLFAVRGSFLVSSTGSDAVLGQWGLAVVAPEDALVVSPQAAEGGPMPLMFFATLDDNRQTPRQETPPCPPN
jgi:environmental stress-induced protein Ves